MNNQELYELLRLDPKKVADPVEFWALYATSFYERLFGKMDDPKLVEKIYNRIRQSPKLTKRAKEALKFFYMLRMDELENPDFWEQQQGKKLRESMKAKLIREYYDPEPDELSIAKMEAQKISKEEGVTQHVNEIRPGVYRVEDWYDDEITVASYENGRALRENLNESMSRHCDFYLATDGKWYLELAHNEYGEWDDATTYGPFNSMEKAEDYLDNFSNPGGFGVDDSGEHEVPTESPNGSKVVNPRSSGMDMYRRMRW